MIDTTRKRTKGRSEERPSSSRRRRGGRTPPPPPLWRCPRCGHRFVTANMWHSCTNHSLAEHFRNKDAGLRKLFDRYLAAVRRFGPVTVIPQKSRITFQGRVRFAGAVIRSKWVEGGVWLTRRDPHPRFFRVEKPVPGCYIHRFRLTTAKDIDAHLRQVLRESYAVGQQEHLSRSRNGPRK